MIQRIDGKMNRATPGPEPKPKRPSLRPFIAVELPNNPWSLCKPEYHDAILVTCGHFPAYVKMLTRNLTADQKYKALKMRRRHRFPGSDKRSFQILTREMDDSPLGGSIWLSRKDVSVTIHDVKSFFQVNWPKLARRYGTDDLASIMERTRESLLAVGVDAYQQRWHLCASLSEHVMRKLDVDIWKVPFSIQHRHNEPGNLQGYNVFGHTNEPVFAYDINSAYLSVMAEFPPLQPFTDFMWHARQELVQAKDPAANVLKLAATVMPGKFTSTLPHNVYYRPKLGHYIQQVTNDRLRQAMKLANSVEEGPNHFNVYRYCVDGFLARTDISQHLNIGTGLGQWKPIKKHNHLSIAQTNVWYTDREWKDNGLPVTEQQIIAASDGPYEIRTTRTVFDWDRLEEREIPVTLRQPHNGLTCRKCWEDDGTELHDLFGMYI